MLKFPNLIQPLILLLFFSVFDTFVILDTFDAVSNTLNEPFTFNPPCPNSTIPFDNNVPKAANGCGSLDWEIAAGKVVYPFTKFFESCCATHDSCFDTCGAPDYLKHYEKCNKKFSSCLMHQCEEVSQKAYVGLMNKVVKKRCEKNARALIKMLKMAGLKAFQRSQNDHCGCR